MADSFLMMSARKPNLELCESTHVVSAVADFVAAAAVGFVAASVVVGSVAAGASFPSSRPSLDPSSSAAAFAVAVGD